MAGIGGKGSVYGTFTNQIELQSHGWVEDKHFWLVEHDGLVFG